MDWGVVRTHGGEEQRARENLVRQGYETLLPMFRQKLVKRGRVVVEEKVLFPRYLFVVVDGRFRSIFGTRGVADLFMSGDKPAVLRRGELEKMGIGQDGVVVAEDVPLFVDGQKVTARAGTFAGCVGKYEGMSGAQRVTVLFQFLGRSVRASIDASCVAAA